MGGKDEKYENASNRFAGALSEETGKRMEEAVEELSKLDEDEIKKMRES